MIIRGEQFDIWAFMHDTFWGGSLWFTCSLAVAELLIFILLLFRWKGLRFYVIISFCFALLALFIKSTNFTIDGSNTIPWCYKSGLVATLFLSIGGIYQKYEKDIDKRLKGINIVIMAGIYLYFIFFQSKSIKINLLLPSMNFLGFVLSIISFYLLVCLTKKLPKSTFIDKIGRQSLGLYLLSGGIPNVIAAIAAKLGFNSNILQFILMSILSFMIAVVVVKVIIKVCPFVFDFRLVKDM